jgi:hypothetical protein
MGWVKRFIFFHGKRHPIEMAEKEINELLSFLEIKKHELIDFCLASRCFIFAHSYPRVHPM